MIFNINSTRGQTRFLTYVARVTCLVNNNIASNVLITVSKAAKSGVVDYTLRND